MSVRVLIAGLFLLPVLAQAAITGAPVQCVGDDFGAAITETIDGADGWASPTSGNKLTTFLALRNDSTAPSGLTCPSGFTEEQVEVPGGSFNQSGQLCTKVSDGTETTLTTSWTTSSFRGNFVACEWDSTDLASGGPVATNEDISNVATADQTSASGAASNTVNAALAITFHGIGQDNNWDDDSYSNSFTEVGDFPLATSSARPGIRVTSKVLSATGSQSTVNTTTDTGDVSYNVILIYDGAPPACSVDDASPVPGTTISVTGCPAFAGNITTLTSPEGDTVTAEAGADTTSAAFIIPPRDQFASGGSMSNTRWDVDGTWTVGDGTTTENLTMQVDPPATAGVDFFGQITRTGEPADSIWPDCCSAAVDNDDYYFEENSGTLTIDTFGIVTAEGTSEGDIRWYDVSLTAWSAISTDTYTTDATAPVISDLSVSVGESGTADANNADFELTTANDGNGSVFYGVYASGGQTCDEIEVGTAGTPEDTGSVSVLAQGTVSGTTGDLTDGTYVLEACHEDASGNDSNVLTSASFEVDTTAPTVANVTVSNINRAAGTVTLAADFTETFTAYYLCTGNSSEGAATLVEDGTEFTPTGGGATETFNNVPVSGRDGTDYCHILQSDDFGNDAEEASAEFNVARLSSYTQKFTDSDMTNDDGTLAANFTGTETYATDADGNVLGLELGAVDLDEISFSSVLGLDERTDEIAMHFVVVTESAHDTDRTTANWLVAASDNSTSDIIGIRFAQLTGQICAVVITSSTAEETACATVAYALGDTLNLRLAKDSGGLSFWYNTETQADNSNVNADADFGAAITTLDVGEDQAGSNKLDVTVKGFTVYDYHPGDSAMAALEAEAFDLADCEGPIASPIKSPIRSPIQTPYCIH